MKLHTVMPPAGYRVLADTGRSQAATMVLEPGKSVAQGEAANDACDQWVYVTLWGRPGVCRRLLAGYQGGITAANRGRRITRNSRHWAHPARDHKHLRHAAQTITSRPKYKKRPWLLRARDVFCILATQWRLTYP